MNLASRALVPLAGLAAVTLSSCADSPAPGLTLTPVKLGGEHADLINTMAGPSLAYRVQYNGDAKLYRVEMEMVKKGESIDKRQLLAGSFETTEALLAFLVTDPRRTGDTSEITGILAVEGTSYHRDEVIAQWDKLASEHGTHWVTQSKRVHFDSVSEPIVLWRWVRGAASGTASSPVSKDADGVWQLTLRFEK